MDTNAIRIWRFVLSRDVDVGRERNGCDLTLFGLALESFEKQTVQGLAARMFLSGMGAIGHYFSGRLQVRAEWMKLSVLSDHLAAELKAILEQFVQLPRLNLDGECHRSANDTAFSGERSESAATRG